MSKLLKSHSKWVIRVIIVILLILVIPWINYGCSKESLSSELSLEPLQEAETGSMISDAPATESVGSNKMDQRDPETQSPIFVYICGSVNCPGVYEFSAGARVYEAVDAAGGLLDDADARQVNLAAQLSDQMQIYIPSVDDDFSQELIPGASDGAADTLVNINKATADQLMTLPGIGQSKAKDIIEYRKAHGGFSNIDELMSIPGIKSGVFDKIRDLVTVN